MSICNSGLLAAVQSPSGRFEAALDSAATLIEKGQFSAATGSLRPWLDSHGNSGRLQALLGTALTRSGKPEEGVRHLELAFDLNRRDPAIVPELVDACLQLRRKPQAEKWLQKLVELPGVPLEIHRAAGAVCVRRGSTDLAVRHLEKVRAINSHPLLLADLASAYFLQGDYSRVSATLDAYARKNSLPPALLSLRGLAALKKGDRSTAIKSFRDAVAADASEGTANFYLGTLAAESGQLKEAIRHLEIAARSYRDQYSANHNLALALYKAERWQEGIAVLEKMAADERSSSAEVHNLLGQGYDRLDRPKEAFDSYQKAIRQDPSNPSYVLDLGLMALRRRTYDLGEIVFVSGVKAFPQNRNLGLALGTTFQLRGQMEKAQQTFQELLTRYPKDAVIYHYLGNSYFEAGRFEDADNAFSRAIALSPGDSLLYYQSAVSLMKAGRADDPRVVGFLDKALELNPRLAAGHYQRAKLAADANDFAAAGERLKRALELDPEMSEAYFLQVRLSRQSGDTAGAAAALKRYEELRARERERLENDRVQGLIYSIKNR
jgi:tetratricopeptide (TPR) repeat protein